jgi:acyl-CoA dehydrogenase
VLGPFEDRESLATVKSWEDEVLVACSLGVMRSAHDAALAHAKEHQAGGKPIIAYQEVGFKLAEMFTLYQSAQLLAYKAAWASDEGRRDAGVILGCAKVFCAESAATVAAEAMQILGGAGFVKGNPAEQGYRDAKYFTVAGVSAEISRMNIGDAVLAAL